MAKDEHLDDWDIHETKKPKWKFYDPAEGWKFGFPKPYKPLKGESLKDTLIRDGYPVYLAQQIEDHKLWCRFIG